MTKKKKTKELVFISTSYGSRGLSSKIGHVEFDGAMNNGKKGLYLGVNRFAKPGGSFSNISSMSLETFEEYILPHGLDENVIDYHFSNEVAMKYGGKGKRAASKLIPKKELKPGVFYDLRNGSTVLFLGNITLNGKSGLGYIRYGFKDTIEETLGDLKWNIIIRKTRLQEIEINKEYKPYSLPTDYKVEQTEHKFVNGEWAYVKSGKFKEIIFNDLI